MSRGMRGGKVSEGTRFLSDETRERDRERARAYKTRMRAADPIVQALKAQHDELVTEFGDLCGICGTSAKAGRRHAIDHDHATGLVRGLLCHRCNVALGGLGDSVEGLEAAIAYLQRHAANPGTRRWAGLKEDEG